MSWWSVWLVVSLAAPLVVQDPASSPLTSEAALTHFADNWKPQQGYMRPLDDQGWKARMEAFQGLVRAGKQAVPVLTEALAEGKDETRVFAAQALSLLAEPATRSVLDQALSDPYPAVRLYATDALSMFGRLETTPRYQKILEKDPNRDVRSHMGFALQRDDAPQPEGIQKSLLEYDLSGMNTARLGQPAPDFTLTDALGKTYRLSQYRDQKPVVLIFIYGDTWPVCHGQLAQLREQIEEFHKRGVQLLAVDPHESYRVRHMLRDVGFEAGDVAFPILADPAVTVSATYGVAFQMNIHTEWSNRPATFIIDRDGVIRYERRATTYSDRPTPEQILTELDKLTGQK